MRSRNKIRNKLLVCIILPVVLLFLFSQICMNSIMRPYLEGLITDKINYTAERRSEQFQNLQNQLYRTTQSLIGNDIIQESLRKTEAQRVDDMQIEKILRYYVYDDVINVAYVSNDLQRMTQAYRSVIETEVVTSLIQLPELQDNYAKPIWVVIDTKDRAEDENLYVVQKLRHLSIDIKPGYLIYHMKKSCLDEIAQTVSSDAEQVYIVDSSGVPIFPASVSQESRRILEGVSGRDSGAHGIRVVQSGEYLASDYYDLKTGWSILSIAQYDKVMQKLNDLQTIITSITIVILMVSACLIFFLTFYYTRPINTIVRAMESFAGARFQARINTRLPDEFGKIGITFNTMADQIDRLIAYAEKSREDLKTAELNSLMYQINPHFIYNTLNNIYMLARISKQTQMAQIIDSLSKFLRISLSKGSSIIPLKDEIEHVTSYLNIQKLRYGELFEFETEIAYEISQCRILKFILQPLVENSINHGFSGMESGGLIRICARAQRDFIEIQVTDNGSGMEQKVLDRLEKIKNLPLEELSALFPEAKGGYGIGNVIARLQLYYGEGRYLHFENRHPGTRCTLLLPKAPDYPDEADGKEI